MPARAASDRAQRRLAGLGRRAGDREHRQHAVADNLAAMGESDARGRRRPPRDARPGPAGLRLDLRLRSHPAQDFLGIGE